MLAELYGLHQQLVRNGLLCPPGFKRSDVHLLVDVGSGGNVRSVVSLMDENGRGKPRTMPDSSRTSSNYAHLVCDKLEYVAGFPSAGASHARAAERHGLFLGRLRDCAAASEGTPSAAKLEAIAAAVGDGPAFIAEISDRGIHLDLRVLDAGADLDEKERKAAAEQAGWYADFLVDGEPIFPTELSGGDRAIIEWWSDFQMMESSGSEFGICQVTGASARLARIFPTTKLPGNGPKLVSANFPAALRYGAEQATGARVSTSVAVGATSALNWLLAGERRDNNSWSVEGLTLAWWADKVPELSPFDELLGLPSADDPGQITDLIRQPIWSGVPGTSPDTRFHVAMLTVNTARVVVLAYHESTLEMLQQRLDYWFAAIEPVRGSVPRAQLGIRALSAAACGPGKNQAKPRQRVATQLLRFALMGSALPLSLRDQTLIRCRVGEIDRSGKRRHVTPQQAALLRLVATSQEDPMPTTPAELCGRIFSVIEATQDAALGELNRGVSAMYAATSTNPSLVLPRLINRRMAHHRKLLRDKGGLAVTLDSRLAELFHQVNEMGGVPGALSSVGQSQFALGYFAERRDRFTKRTGEPPSDTQEEMQ